MKKLLLSAALVGLSSIASADYFHPVTINRITINDAVSISSGESIQNTCSYFGAKLKFDATTPKGKSMLSLVLLAKATGQPISVWYTPTTGTGDENSGCNPGNLAVVNEVGMY
ncbi:hypothetical protein H0A36_14045 [Endozoicomonas sp. SM1973]|uniref:Uncharacterized protein n=1 Tax=Spartinivicinus marinus TaxID=2994442 RepID=A0A853I911_9GAMM|nr:hypothetical protein [Spartinivicinus marinus]MCX4028597.1 hypothetical protein [Spartinivicinus marinus]NYZ67138.1 hypothetical protein [Spartinivicinus marinus]